MNLPEAFTSGIATNQDIPVIRQLVHQVMEEFGILGPDDQSTRDLEDIEANFKNGYFGLLKDSEQQIIATFALYPLSDTTVELRKMYLLPEHRAKGLGKWMLQSLLQKAKDLGYSKIELQTASVLHAAIALYRKTGFDEVTSSNASPQCDRAFEMSL